MKSITGLLCLVPVAMLLAGCASDNLQPEQESMLGMREQKALLIKAQPVEEFNITPALPFGNGTLYLGSTLLEPDQAALAPFESSGMPVIRIKGSSGRKSLTVLLDTASNASWIEYSSAAPNGVIFLSNKGQVIPYLGTANTEGITTYAGIIPELHIGMLNLNQTPFYVRMVKGKMKPVVYSTKAPRVDAVLGYDNLRQFEYIQFDLRAGTVRFSTSTGYRPNEDRLIGSAAISGICLDSLAVSGAIDGQLVPIILDFAGDYAFARGDVRIPATKQIELGEVVFVDVPTEVLTVQDLFPRAGRAMLEKYLVTVCPRAGVVYFERPTGMN